MAELHVLLRSDLLRHFLRSSVRPIPSLPIENPEIWNSRPLVFPRLICRFIFKRKVQAFSGLLYKYLILNNDANDGIIAEEKGTHNFFPQQPLHHAQ